MPGFDRTGPLGTGPIGRGLGPCGGGMAYGWGRGRGFRRGGWFGWGPAAVPPLAPEDEKSMLEQQKSFLENQLNAITQRLEGLDK